MNEYLVVIEPAGGNYSAYVPDLPGVISVGDTISEAKANIAEAVELYLEDLRERGDAIPEPRTTATSVRHAGHSLTHKPTHPGAVLNEMLNARDLQVITVARATGVSAQRLYDIIKGRRNVTADTAIRLGEYFTVSPQFWMRLASDYDLWTAIQARKSA